MWYGLLLEMLDEQSHLVQVTKTAILLVESKVGRMKVYNKTRRFAFMLAENVRFILNYKRSTRPGLALRCWDVPNGSGYFFCVLRSSPVSIVTFLVESLCNRPCGCSGLCVSFLFWRTMPFGNTVFVTGIGGGCFCPGSLFVALDGEGEVWEVFIPLLDVCKF